MQDATHDAHSPGVRQTRVVGRRRLLATAVATGLLVTAAAAAGIPVRATYGAQTSGDEPYYLLTAQSLGSDADLDVADEHTGRDYRPFHERTLDPQAAPGPGGRMVVPHDPLLPALLAAPIRLGGWVSAKATLAALAGLLAGVVTWTAVRRFGASPLAGAVTAGVLGASAPLAVYGSQVYPELPAALALALAIVALTGPMRARGTVLLAGAVVALPWLGVKYVPVAGVLALLGLAGLWRAGRRRWAAGAAGALVAAGVAYGVAHMAWYGGLTPYAAGSFFTEHGGQLSVLGTGPDYLGRTVRLLGLLVDRGFGVAAWQPAWLLGAPAVAALVRCRPSGWTALLLPLTAGWLTATFAAATMHGWWFPGRHAVAVLPAAALAIAWWVGDGRRRLAIVGAAGLAGVVTYVWLVAEGWQERLTWVIDFGATSGVWYRAWRLVLPAYQAPSTATWALHGVWIAAVAVLCWWGWRSVRDATR